MTSVKSAASTATIEEYTIEKYREMMGQNEGGVRFVEMDVEEYRRIIGIAPAEERFIEMDAADYQRMIMFNRVDAMAASAGGAVLDDRSSSPPSREVVAKLHAHMSQLVGEGIENGLTGRADNLGVRDARESLTAAQRGYNILQNAMMIKLRMAGGLDGFIEEHRFHPVRRWRFDIAWPEERIAIEIQGGVGNKWKQGKGKHVRPAGYQNDCDKLNAAQLLGWMVFYVTAEHMKGSEILDTLREALAIRRRVGLAGGEEEGGEGFF